jgi:hypothetical protein
MLRRLATYTSVTLLLSSCFLQQKAPDVQQKSMRPPIKGIVRLEDRVTQKKAVAGFIAQFQRGEVGSKNIRGAYELLSERADTMRGASCQFAKEKRTKEKSASRSSKHEAETLSVGGIQFGQALQSVMLTPEEDEDHQYFKGLEPDFAPGLYQVLAEGNEGAPPFQELLSMPEALRDVRFNNLAFDDAALKLKKMDGLAFQWRTPSILHDLNILIAEIDVQTDTEVAQLFCMARETELATDSPTLEWRLPREKVAQLPVGKLARAYFTRIHSRTAKDPRTKITFQGVRSYINALVIEE